MGDDMSEKVAGMINDPIGTVHRRLLGLDKAELIKIILIAGNRMATLKNGGKEYTNGDEAVRFISGALDEIMAAYETANMLAMSADSKVLGSA